MFSHIIFCRATAPMESCTPDLALRENEKRKEKPRASHEASRWGALLLAGKCKEIRKTCLKDAGNHLWIYALCPMPTQVIRVLLKIWNFWLETCDCFPLTPYQEGFRKNRRAPCFWAFSSNYLPTLAPDHFLSFARQRRSGAKRRGGGGCAVRGAVVWCRLQFPSLQMEDERAVEVFPF